MYASASHRVHGSEVDWTKQSRDAAARVTVTVPHYKCEDSQENRRDQVASKTWQQFVRGLESNGVPVSTVFLGNQYRDSLE